jgi:hypothetical protein
LTWITLVAGSFAPISGRQIGTCDEPGFSSSIFHFPMLRLVIEFEVAGPGHLKPSQFM